LYNKRTLNCGRINANGKQSYSINLQENHEQATPLHPDQQYKHTNQVSKKGAFVLVAYFK